MWLLDTSYSYYIYYNGLRRDFKKELILYVMKFKLQRDVSFDFRVEIVHFKSQRGVLHVRDMDIMLTSVSRLSVLSVNNLNIMITSTP